MACHALSRRSGSSFTLRDACWAWELFRGLCAGPVQRVELGIGEPMKRGQRTINGRVYLLGGRTTGLNAKAVALSEASAKRQRGKLVRLIKISEFDYLIYEL